MAKATVSVEDEVLKVTGEKPQGKKEERSDYLLRVIKVANNLEEDVWGEMSGPAQDWLEATVNAVNKKKAPVDFPDAGDDDEPADDEDETPAPKKKPVAAADDDEPAPAKKKLAPADDDEPVAPKKKPVVAADDEDEPAAPKKKPAIAEDDDEPAPKPKKKPAIAEDDDEPAPAPKPKVEAKPELTAEEKAARKAAITRIRRLLIKNRDRTVADVAEILEAKGDVLPEKLTKIYFDDTVAVLNLAAELGYLRDEPEAAE